MTTVTVKSGDTLWSLAQRHLGNGRRWPEIWRRNAQAIACEQKLYPNARLARGMIGPDWIFPGTALVMPELQQ